MNLFREERGTHGATPTYTVTTEIFYGFGVMKTISCISTFISRGQ